MDTTTIDSFFDELEKIASGGEAPTHIPTGGKEKWKAFKSGVRGEVGPAVGATVGAGLASMYGINPLAGAAAGYGAGALPDIVKGIRDRIALGRAAKLVR